MAANSTISVTELDFDDIKVSLKNFLKSQPEFLDFNFEGSAISLLIDMLAYNTYQNAYYTSMVGNEMFLDSAQLRESVVSRAKMLNYMPTSARGANTNFTITITPTGSPTSVTVDKNTEWTASVDGQTLKFVTPEAYTLTSDNNYSGTITVVEGQPLTHRFTVDNLDTQRFILPNENVDTSSIVVDVQESATDTSSTRYNLANDLTQVQANSAVYFLEEESENRYEVYFGDGVLGKAPTNGNIVIINYRSCNGILGNDIGTFTDPSTVAGSSVFTKTVNANTSGGAAFETVDSIKFNAPKNFEAQNRAVLAEDYKRIILRETGDIQSISVWGGEENDPPIYGKVYLAVKPVTGNVISSTRKNQIKDILKKHNVLSIDTEFVDAQYLYVNPTTTVRWDPNATTLSAGAVQDKINTAISNFETNNLNDFEKQKFRFSQFTRVIDDADPSVLSSLTDILMERRFAPSTTTKATYNIPFNQKLFHPHAGHAYAISSSKFTFNNQDSYLDDDGNGNIRIYYLNAAGQRVVLDSTAGTVNYTTGLVKLDAFLPTAYTGSSMSIYAEPNDKDITAVRNQILLIANAKVTVLNDVTSQVDAKTVTATTSGVTTTVVDSGLYPVVY
jgi:hypothetical protein